MKNSILAINILFIVGMVLVYAGCKGKINVDSTKADKIQLHFSDSSVPPQYHRSYTIDVNASNAAISVNSYGTITAKDQHSVTQAQFEVLQKTAADLQGAGSFYTNASGTSSKTIKLFENGKEVYSLSWDNLSENKVSDVSTKMTGQITALIPNFLELLSKPVPGLDEEG